ncbi:hypothetical protein S40288_07067 [Stachybotrys chartarum IBT 40288]|nr:hypothetical protein S40288_07067 [Stachybotrys chartarum IBT 40288]
MQQRSKYQYTKLPSGKVPRDAQKPQGESPKTTSRPRSLIRLLELLPGVANDELCLTVRLADLNDRPSYEALSYVWGSETNPLRISIGRRWSLDISQNLECALRHIRYEDRSRTLWVDAVCINQEDLQERSQQVAMMGDIYELASRVIVWLGPEENDSDRALDFFASLASMIHVNWAQGTMRPSAFGQSQPQWADESPVPFDDIPKDYAAIRALVNRPWFERVWIRQEITLGSSRSIVMCGNKVILWQDFRNAIWCLSTKGDDQVDDPDDQTCLAYKLPFISNLCRAQLRNIRSVLADVRSAKCKDPRDRVYGLLNLLEPHVEELGIVPDYNLTTTEVYLDLVLKSISHHKSLKLLRSAGLQRNVPKLPSWVPDLTVEKGAVEGGQFTNATAQLPPQASYLGDGVLKVAGIAISRIAQASPICGDTSVYDHPHIFHSMEALRSNEPRSKEALAYYGNKVNLREAYCRAVSFDQFDEKMFPRSTESPGFRESSTEITRILDAKEITDDTANRSTIHFLANTFVCGRSICIAEDGRLGLVPLSAQPGDLVCVLLGCSTAMTLRKTPDSPESYELVGETWMDGVMDGEAVLGPLPDDFRAVWRQEYFGEAVFYCPSFLNTRKASFSWEDPRLSQFQIDRKGFEGGTRKDGESLARLVTADMLKERGVQLNDFLLV